MKAIGRCLGPIVAALILTLAVTWPLATCPGRCLPPPPDSILTVYFLAWTGHALTTPGVRLLDAPMFAPYANTLVLGDWMPAAAPLTVPVLLLTGNPVAAHNVLLVALYTGAALGAALLAHRLLGARAPALVAGVAFAYSARLLDQAYNLQTVGIAWVPWICLALERFVVRPSWGRATMVGVAALGLAFTSLNLLAYAGLPLGLLGLALLGRGGRLVGAAGLGRLGTVGMLAMAILWGYLAPVRRVMQEWGLGRTLTEVAGNALTLDHLIRPPPESLLRYLVAGAVAPVPADGLLPGVTLVSLAFVGILALVLSAPPARRSLGPYLAVGAATLLLAFGPTLVTSWGSIPLPYRVLYALVPGFGAVRTPARFVFFVDLVVALLAAVGAMQLAGRFTPGRARTMVVGALALLLLVESVLVPFPGAVPRLDPAALPDVYRWLARTPPDTMALAIPMGDWANVAASAFHFRRTVNGWASFLPPRYPDLVAAMAGFPDRRSVALVRGVRPDVVLVDRAWLSAERVAALAGPEWGLTPAHAFEGHLVYRTTAAPPPGVESLEAEAGEGPACVTLRNPGPEFVPLYPARRLRLEASGAAGGRRVVTEWLPVDLAPGGRHVACVNGADQPAALRGTIEDGEHRHTFVVVPGQLPVRPRREAGP